MRSPVTTSAAVPPLACVGRKGKPKTSFLPMLGTVLRWGLLLLLLLYCEAAIVVAYDTAVEMDSRNCLEIRLPRHGLDENSLDSHADDGTGWHRKASLTTSKSGTSRIGAGN